MIHSVRQMDSVATLCLFQDRTMCCRNLLLLIADDNYIVCRKHEHKQLMLNQEEAG